MCDAVHRYGRVWQTGSQQRSAKEFRQACEYVRNGRIGKLHTIHVELPHQPNTAGDPTPMPVPQELDYDMWLGPAPWAPYTEKRVHPQRGYSRQGWMRIGDYTRGMITNWGAHHIDIAQWALGYTDSGPSFAEGTANFPNHPADFDPVAQALGLPW